MNTTAAPSAQLTVAGWPGLTPRLLRVGEAASGVEDLTEYRAAGGYRRLDDADVDALLAEIELSGLIGRGGAAFPIAVKLRTVRDNGRLRSADGSGKDSAGDAAATSVVANGEEGEPASVKDRWLLRHRPHLVLDGLRLAARIVGADHAHVYVSDPQSAAAVEAALRQLGAANGLAGLSVRVRIVDPGYVAGEETAAVRAINGGPAKPTDKPPRPFEEGVAGLPTLISNVETLANLPYVHQYGAQDYRSVGTSGSAGTFLATVTGGGRAPGLYELPFGVAVTELLATHGVPADRLRGVLMGGYFAGLLNREVLDTTLDHDSLRLLGSGLGCGAISVIADECPVAVAASVLSYFDRENADQCGSCFNGTAAMAAAAGALRDGVATAEDLTRLERWSVVLRGRGACATLDAATNIAASLLAKFPHEVAQHLQGECSQCAAGAFSAQRPYEVAAAASIPVNGSLR